MNGKKARALRKAVKLNQNVDLKTPDLRIAKKTSKMKYVQEMQNGVMTTVAKSVNMITIMNANKVQYRAFKKVFKALPRPVRNTIKEN